jgi:hypothetical protein
VSLESTEVSLERNLKKNTISQCLLSARMQFRYLVRSGNDCSDTYCSCNMLNTLLLKKCTYVFFPSSFLYFQQCCTNKNPAVCVLHTRKLQAVTCKWQVVSFLFQRHLTTILHQCHSCIKRYFHYYSHSSQIS